MLGKFEAVNLDDLDGNPAGGHVLGTGLRIDWQDGPLGRGEGRSEPNGAFVETVITASSSSTSRSSSSNQGVELAIRGSRSLWSLIQRTPRPS
jgi:hypothetical protein